MKASLSLAREPFLRPPLPLFPAKKRPVSGSRWGLPPSGFDSWYSSMNCSLGGDDSNWSAKQNLEATAKTPSRWIFSPNVSGGYLGSPRLRFADLAASEGL